MQFWSRITGQTKCSYGPEKRDGLYAIKVPKNRTNPDLYYNVMLLRVDLSVYYNFPYNV